MKYLLIIAFMLFSSFSYADRVLKCEKGNVVLMNKFGKAYLAVKHLDFLGKQTVNNLKDRKDRYVLFHNVLGTEARLTVQYKHVILKIQDKEEKCQLL